MELLKANFQSNFDFIFARAKKKKKNTKNTNNCNGGSRNPKIYDY